MSVDYKYLAEDSLEPLQSACHERERHECGMPGERGAVNSVGFGEHCSGVGFVLFPDPTSMYLD